MVYTSKTKRGTSESIFWGTHKDGHCPYTQNGFFVYDAYEFICKVRLKMVNVTERTVLISYVCVANGKTRRGIMQYLLVC